jgi:hypothetical protein
LTVFCPIRQCAADQFLASRARATAAPALDEPEDREAMFRQFMDWSRRQ